MCKLTCGTQAPIVDWGITVWGSELIGALWKRVTGWQDAPGGRRIRPAPLPPVARRRAFGRLPTPSLRSHTNTSLINTLYYAATSPFSIYIVIDTYNFITVSRSKLSFSINVCIYNNCICSNILNFEL